MLALRQFLLVLLAASLSLSSAFMFPAQSATFTTLSLHNSALTTTKSSSRTTALKAEEADESEECRWCDVWAYDSAMDKAYQNHYVLSDWVKVSERGVL